MASGLPHATLALFGLGFPPATRLLSLNLAAYGNSQAHSTKGTPSPLARLRPLVGPRFQVLFHSPPGVLFTFPSRYYALSVAAEYSALEGGPPCFSQDSSCPGLLRHGAKRRVRTSPTGLSPAPAGLPRPFGCPRATAGCPGAALQPRARRLTRFGLLPVRSPLLGESRLISSPAGT